MCQIQSRSSEITDLGWPRMFIFFLETTKGCFGVCFCIAGSINGVYGYLEPIYRCPGVKVTQGHACHGLRSSFGSLIFLTLQLFWASETLFRAKLMPDSESTPMNWLQKTRNVSMSSEVIRDHLRSLNSDDLECSNFLLGSTTGCFGVLMPNSAPIYWLRSILEHPYSHVRRPAASVWPDLWGHRLSWDLKIGYHSLRLVKTNTFVFVAKL